MRMYGSVVALVSKYYGENKGVAFDRSIGQTTTTTTVMSLVLDNLDLWQTIDSVTGHEQDNFS